MEVKLKKKSDEHFIFQVTTSEGKKRLDIFLSSHLKELSRSLIKKYINDKTQNIVLVNSHKKKANYILKERDLVEVNIPEIIESPLKPLNLNLDIIYEDDDLIAINKPPGITVHPSSGHENDTIVNALIYYLGSSGSLSNIGGIKRPGIVHRLDKDTSGIMIIAKNDFTHNIISKEFSTRKIEKTYEAIVKGIVTPLEGVIEKPIARSIINRKKFTVSETGREAITYYKTIDSKDETTWIMFMPKTGRTHQIRVHSSSIGYPIIGDKLYSRKSYKSEYIALVARRLKIIHPRTKRSMVFEAPYPEHFIKLACDLGYDITQNI